MVVFYFLPIVILVLPTTLPMPNPYAFYIVLGVAIGMAIAPFFNRAGLVLVSGLFLLTSVAGGLTSFILTTMPLNETALQLYDFYALTGLLALAILPIRAIWAFTVICSTIILLDLIYQPRTETFTTLINHEGFVTIATRPVMLLVVVACAGSLLLTNIAKAVRQGYEAEFVANIEHAAAQQNESEARGKRELEESIQQLVQTHTDIMNGRIKERIPYPAAKVLWPLVGIQNSLWTRLQRAQQRENELAQLHIDIEQYNAMVQNATQNPRKPLESYPTKTILSPLSISVSHLHKETLRSAGVADEGSRIR
jgi:hypothetical protein